MDATDNVQPNSVVTPDRVGIADGEKDTVLCLWSAGGV